MTAPAAGNNTNDPVPPAAVAPLSPGVLAFKPWFGQEVIVQFKVDSPFICIACSDDGDPQAVTVPTDKEGRGSSPLLFVHMQGVLQAAPCGTMLILMYLDVVNSPSLRSRDRPPLARRGTLFTSVWPEQIAHVTAVFEKPALAVTARDTEGGGFRSLS
jgi:hypothetical protein